MAREPALEENIVALLAHVLFHVYLRTQEDDGCDEQTVRIAPDEATLRAASGLQTELALEDSVIDFMTFCKTMFGEP